LGVEEQFYLFWPWVNKKIDSLIAPIIIFIVVIIGVKLLLHQFFPNSIVESIISVTRFHCMMIGALGSIFYKNENSIFLKIADNKITQCICWFIIFLALINKYHVISVLDNEIIAVVAIFLIIGQIRVKNRIINLELNVMNFLGKISYGMYVIHPLLIFLLSKLLGDLNIYTPVKYVLIYLIVTGTTILLSYLSYTYIESYFLNFKKKFEVVKSSPTKV
jgi:peptidoglycan/LPS O-acetylase OafA/YrhL